MISLRSLVYDTHAKNLYFEEAHRNVISWDVNEATAHGNGRVTGYVNTWATGNVSELTQAIKEVTGIFSVQNFWDLSLEEEVRLGFHVIEAAINVGNHPHMVYSSLGAEQRQNVAAIDGRALIEENLRSSGLPFTILRPGLFMDNFRGASLPFARPIQKLLDGHRPLAGPSTGLCSLSAWVGPSPRAGSLIA